ncbi:hypothetical protein BWD42_13700 [Sphingobacterium sp. CZ-UAM]|nr:hypothetical protein BWD42_13700 [Sphingobacterium sp. CZ-UAM]
MVKFIHLNTASGKKVVFNVDNIIYLTELKDSKDGSKTQVSYVGNQIFVVQTILEIIEKIKGTEPLY